MRIWIICGVVSVTIFFIFIQPYLLQLQEEKELATLASMRSNETIAAKARK